MSAHPETETIHKHRIASPPSLAGIMNLDDAQPKGPPGDPAEGLGHSIDRLFADMGSVGAAARGQGDSDEPESPRVEPSHTPSFPDAARNADLLDEVEIHPIEEDPGEKGRLLREMEEEILRDAEERARKHVDVVPLGASVLSGVDEVPVAEWTVEQAAKKLEPTVAAFLSAGADKRDEIAEQVRGLVWRLQEFGDLNSVAETVERLALVSDDPSSPSLALARRLLTPPITRKVAGRIGAAARDEERRKHIIQAASRLGESMATALADALTDATERSERRAFIEALTAFGDAAIRVAEDMTFDRRWFVVRNAMLVLREVAGEAALEHFIAALGHDDARVRREAIHSLGKVGGEKAGALVTGKLADPDAEVRQAAAVAVGALKVSRAVRPLLERLEEEEEAEVQAAILLSLGQLGDPGAVPAIEKRAAGGLFAKKAPTAVRLAAYRALAAIGTPHAKQLLAAAVTDGDPEVREAAARLAAKPR